jgi:hypothetical protein
MIVISLYLVLFGLRSACSLQPIRSPLQPTPNRDADQKHEVEKDSRLLEKLYINDQPKPGKTLETKPPPICNLGRCVTSPLKPFNRSKYMYQISSAMSLTTPDLADVLPEKIFTSKSFDNSNFAAMSFRLSLLLCGTKGNIHIYKAQLLDIITRCNDLSGTLEASSNSEINRKMARAMGMCDVHPLLRQGPSSNWFVVALEAGHVVGVDFPNDDSILSAGNEQKDYVYQNLDRSFKKHFIKDLLFATPSQVCMPALNSGDCTAIDRNNTLLLNTRNSDENHGEKSEMVENLKRTTLSSYEVTKYGELNRANSFETVTFEINPLKLDSTIGSIIHQATLKTRWELARIYDDGEKSNITPSASAPKVLKNIRGGLNKDHNKNHCKW